jgi:signal transduction histidine kinase
MAALDQKWSDAAAALMLDQDNQVTRAIATCETWSGIVISWPVDGTSERLPVELSGLPVFDRDRGYRGYRGFGVCRDIARINQLLRVRRERPIEFKPVPETAQALNGGAPVVEGRQSTAVPGQPATERPARPERPALTIAPAAANVLPFRQAPALEAKPPVLSAGERKAFRELAQELTARLRGMPDAPGTGESASDRALAEELLAPSQVPGALPSSPRVADSGVTEASLNGDANVDTEERLAAPVVDTSLLDRIPIGVLVYRYDALIYANRHFLDWIGYDGVDALTAAGGLNSLFVEPAADVFSDNPAALSLSIMTRQGDTLPIDGRLFTVPWNGAPAMALILTNGPAAERRRTVELALTTAETELRNAKHETQRAAAAKAEFLSKVSHELRTPLNSITGFAEVILSERFGPIGNERYGEYLKNIHEAGTHLVSLINDMLDLSKVESGQLDLTLVNVSLNDLTRQCVGIMQPQANRARIIIRTSITPGVPQVVVDERSLRQILINLLANAIKFTGPGGQVIVSTAISDSGEVILRVRDTGVGMTEKDIEAALEPYRQSATSGSWGSGGTGLGLPLTRALAEANRANFSIKSAPNAGTLVEVAFPRTRLAAN